MTQETTERIDSTPENPLPNGGAYAVVHYQDSDGSPTEKESALRAEIIEYSIENVPVVLTIIDMTEPEEDETLE